MNASEIMTKDPACCTPDTSAQDVARLMRETDCGAIPVVQDLRSNKLIGMVTDRDLAVRGLADGRSPDTPICEMMSSDIQSVREDADAKEVKRVMKEHQVRRVPVVNESGECVGIIAQADLARDDGIASDREVGRVVERISEPSSKAEARRGGEGELRA